MSEAYTDAELDKLRERYADTRSWPEQPILPKRLLATISERDARIEELSYSPQDKDDQWTDQIKAAHPVKTGSSKHYVTALEMVGNRRGKGALVEMANWLLTRAEAAEAKVAELEKEVRTYRRAETSRRQGDELQDAIAQRLATPPQTAFEKMRREGREQADAFAKRAAEPSPFSPPQTESK